MVTGDNLLTALSVARECAIIQPAKRAFLVETAPLPEKSADKRTPLILKQVVFFFCSKLHSFSPV